MTSTAAATYMCTQATPARLNNIYGINSVATTMFVQRFALAGRATDRKIMSVGIATNIIAMSKNTYEMSNTNTFPAKISVMEPGMYK